MTPCCEWLKNMIDRAGEQGTAVIAIRERSSDLRRFYIQARMLTAAQQTTWQRLLSIEPSKSDLDQLFRDEGGRLHGVAVSMLVPILFCPHCGTDLEKFIRRHQAAFDELCEAHLPFAAG